MTQRPAPIRELRHIEEHAAQTGQVHEHDVKLLQQLLYSDGKIDRNEADFLVRLHKRVAVRSPKFEQFYYQTLKRFVLADGRIGAVEAAWLREVLLADGKLQDEERRFLRELRGEAQERSPQFDALLDECEKLPPEQHTSR
jgi:uncharacterized tellurite resistance protein B-like protein